MWTRPKQERKEVSQSVSEWNKGNNKYFRHFDEVTFCLEGRKYVRKDECRTDRQYLLPMVNAVFDHLAVHGLYSTRKAQGGCRDSTSGHPHTQSGRQLLHIGTTLQLRNERRVSHHPTSSELNFLKKKQAKTKHPLQSQSCLRVGNVSPAEVLQGWVQATHQLSR